MKFFCAVFIISCVLTSGVFGGGASCSELIDFARTLSANIRSVYINLANDNRSKPANEKIALFQAQTSAFLDSSDLSSEDANILRMIEAGGDIAADCVNDYFYG
ncbi:unnamed protein product [Chironomus riparius]|uniref:Uncharacterized protein n=1 Tax=Chironomus riparius TaxID=315576 RepID=A0A9P0NP39_9DIPT|nr:unnamed protein product [Chironomus riparius]